MIPEGSDKPPKLERFNGQVKCDLKYCKIGAFYYKTTEQNFDLGSSPNFDGIFYVGYEATKEYKFLFLMHLSIVFKKDLLHVVACPNEAWISEHSLSKYIVDKNDIIPFPKKNESNQSYYYYKIKPYQDSKTEIFLKCGHINQESMPPIDVGYVWGSKQKEELSNENNILFYQIDSTDLRIDSENGLLNHYGQSLLKKSIAIYQVLSPDNNYNSNTTIVGRYKNDSKLYSGQKVLVLHLQDYDKLNENVKNAKTGHYFRFIPQYRVSNIETTLRLKVNGVIQKIETTNNSDVMDTYTVDLGGIKNGPVGCNAVPDNKNLSILEDFYEKRYRFDLLYLDTKTSRYIKINDTKSLVSNSIYKCGLNKETTNLTELGENNIKETQFILRLIGSMNSDESTPSEKSTDSTKSNDSTKSKSTIWIITGVSVGVLLIITLLLLAGLIFYKKRLMKKKGSKNSLSSGKSSSASKSSSAIKSDSNFSGIQNKAGNGGSKNIMNKKNVSNENLKISNQNVKRSKEVRSYEVQNK
uniref:Sporozoite surface protein 3 n=1 Tax=Strongyloides papillosus TaxID=174720 RepID=A0A0N5BMU0_STREA